MEEFLPYVAGAVGLISLLVSIISVRTARRGLAIARISGQVSYEQSRFGRESPLDLTISSVTFRGPTKLKDSEGLLSVHSKGFLETDADHIEVVVEGRLRNNLAVELLLTSRDHPRSGRKVEYRHRHHNVWQLDGKTMEFGRAILGANAEATFTWIDRRSPDAWSAVRLRALADPALEILIPRIGLSDLPLLARHPSMALAARLHVERLPHIGFQLIAETRAVERIATIWAADVTADPRQMVDEGKNDFFSPANGPFVIKGPIDDDVIKYRVRYDAVLASVERKRSFLLSGRET